ncbi:mercury resistance system periplasmic binding protein MerP [Alteromonas macleodii]|uniref:Periplasmic mercury ion-binding protein n=1 Tax=Alteromonas macleodii TaxID=28108 RepID=A0AB36FKV6_ALTMA|nr:mercury resistance system periplasmic binding protein MerP [Alteromonas macleodii]OES24452.1 mercuric transport protein periplasmic component [Alteromonas macleodii]OES25509.1 mercuric transport protein periplasmic component [Alteromonas macleodii]OES38669.1 mercuric transport protein periplasmic component [Alteromonas macleodii]
MQKFIVSLIFTLASLSAWADPQTVTLLLPTMNCAMCPITVKKALSQVEGVTKAKVSYEDKKAVVTFDDTHTSIEKLIEATTNAGYPSNVVETKTP